MSPWNLFDAKNQRRDTVKMTVYLPKEKPQIRSLVVNNGVIDMSGWHPCDVIVTDGDRPGPFVCDYMKNPFSSIVAHLTMDITSRCEDAIEYFKDVINGVRCRCIELDPSRESTRKRFPWVNPFWDKIRVDTSFGQTDDDGVYVSLGERFTDFDAHAVRCIEGLRFFTGWTNNQDVVTQSILLLGPIEILADFEKFVRQNSVRVFDNCCYGRTGVFGNAVLNLTMEFGVLDKCRAKFRRLAAHGGEYTISGADRQFGRNDMIMHSGGATPKVMYAITRTRIHWAQTARLRWPYYYESLVDICIAMSELALPVYVILEIVDWLPKMELTNRWKRVRVIERVKASIERVYANRNSTKRSNKRTKK